jgi:hypothetical protein
MDVLAECERKYMAKLSGAMIPVMIDAFFDLYAEAKKQSQGRKTLLQYQALLVEVKNWNNMMMKQHTDAIIKQCAMFPNLLAAVFVISVKIMSAVRISTESKKLNIKLPTNDVFVHSCYMAAAKDLYEDPYIIVDDIKESEKRCRLYERFSKCIKEVIESFIPVQQILETYIPSFTGGELDMDQGIGADPADVDEAEEAASPPVTPEAAEAAAEEGATPSPEGETPATPSPVDPVPGTPAGADPNGEIKQVPVTPEPAKPAVHHETLFDDAPDKK